MKKAFTLIELIFVIVIIGLLAAVAVPRFMTVEQNAKFKPAIAVTREIIRKWEEQYHQLQDMNMTRVVLSDPHILQYLKALTTDVDKHFVWDVRGKEDYSASNKSPATVFAIGYKTKKLIPGNVYYKDTPPDGTPIPVDDKYIQWFSNVPDNKRVHGVKNCIQVKLYIKQVPVNIDHNITEFEINLSKVDPTCMQAAD